MLTSLLLGLAAAASAAAVPIRQHSTVRDGSMHKNTVGDWPNLTLKMITDAAARGALCNDGTDAGFYVATNSSSTVWTLHLEGGYWCSDESSCTNRAKTQPELTSSSSWTSTKPMLHGILSPDPSVTSEALAYANKVFVPYCSSDAWIGNATKEENSMQWYFAGRNIIRGVVEDLLGMGMAQATQVLFTGCSAGGQGVVNNADFVASLVPSSADYRAIGDAGWLVNFPPFSDSVASLAAEMSAAHSLWKSALDPDCAAANSDDPSLCLFSPTAALYIQAPILIQTEQDDMFQLPRDIGHGPPYNAAELAYTYKYRSEVQRTLGLLRPPSAAFSPSCYGHCFTESDYDYTTIQVRDASGGMWTLKNVVDSWLSGSPVNIYSTCTENQAFNCSIGCHSF